MFGGNLTLERYDQCEQQVLDALQVAELNFILQYQENTQKFVHFPSIFALLLHALKRLLIEPNIYPKFCL
jgi:hypothetical protein